MVPIDELLLNRKFLEPRYLNCIACARVVKTFALCPRDVLRLHLIRCWWHFERYDASQMEEGFKIAFPLTDTEWKPILQTLSLTDLPPFYCPPPADCTTVTEGRDPNTCDTALIVFWSTMIKDPIPITSVILSITYAVNHFLSLWFSLLLS